MELVSRMVNGEIEPGEAIKVIAAFVLGVALTVRILFTRKDQA